MNHFVVLNAIGFQVCWWSLVVFGNVSLLWVAPLLLAHFYAIRSQQKILLRVFLAFAAGASIDICLFYACLFTFPPSHMWPFWLIGLWLCFASTLDFSLKFFIENWLGRIIFVGFGMPMSYIAAEKLGSVTIQVEGLQKYFLFWPHALVILGLYFVFNRQRSQTSE